MKSLITALLLICSFPILAQQNGTININNRYLKYGDNYYTKNIRGLKQFMVELPDSDAQAYQKMIPEWDRMRTNQSVGVALVITSSVVGVGIMVSAVGVEGDSQRAGKRVITGAVVGLVPAIIGALMIPKENDILNFVNQFNRVAEGDKLRLSWQAVARV